MMPKRSSPGVPPSAVVHKPSNKYSPATAKHVRSYSTHALILRALINFVPLQARAFARSYTFKDPHSTSQVRFLLASHPFVPHHVIASSSHHFSTARLGMSCGEAPTDHIVRIPSRKAGMRPPFTTGLSPMTSSTFSVRPMTAPAPDRIGNPRSRRSHPPRSSSSRVRPYTR